MLLQLWSGLTLPTEWPAFQVGLATPTALHHKGRREVLAAGSRDIPLRSGKVSPRLSAAASFGVTRACCLPGGAGSVER